MKALLPQLLQRLKDGESLAINDDKGLDLVAEEIVDALNELKPAYGNLAMSFDTALRRLMVTAGSGVFCF